MKMKTNARSGHRTILLTILLTMSFFIGMNLAHAGLENERQKVVERVGELQDFAAQKNLVVAKEFSHFLTRFEKASSKESLLKALSFGQEYFSFMRSSVKNMKVSRATKVRLSAELKKTLEAVTSAKKAVSSIKASEVKIVSSGENTPNETKEKHNPTSSAQEINTAHVASAEAKPSVEKSSVAQTSGATVAGAAAAVTRSANKKTPKTGGQAAFALGSVGAVAGLVLLTALGIGLGLRRFKNKNKHISKSGRKEFNGLETKSANASQVSMSVYKNVPNPVICVNDKGMIIWSNVKASEELMLTNGSTFFLDQECRKDKDSGELFYESEKGSEFWLTSNTIRYKNQEGKMLIMTPSAYFKGKLSYREVEGSMDIAGALKQALLKLNYLFADGGVPLFIEKKADTGAVDKKEEQVFAKALFLVYHLAKDVRNPRVNLVIDKVGKKNLLQMDIRGLKMGEIDFEKELVYEGSSGTIGDLWSEVELSLSRRQARIVCQNNDQIGGVSIKLIMSKAPLAYTSAPKPTMSV